METKLDGEKITLGPSGLPLRGIIFYLSISLGSQLSYQEGLQGPRDFTIEDIDPGSLGDKPS